MQELQKEIKDFCTKHALNAPIEHRLLDLTSELGEVCKEVLKMTNYGTKQLTKNSEIEGELGDVLFSLITLANLLDVDLKMSLNKVIAKYEKRLNKGSAGSECEF